MSRTSAGRLVEEADKNSRTFETVWTGRTFNLIAVRPLISILRWQTVESGIDVLLPPGMVTWMAILSADSSLLEVLEVAESDRERMVDV